jgi:hypothetical protein
VRLHRVGRKRDCPDLCQGVGVEHRDVLGVSANDLAAIRDGDRPDSLVGFDDVPAEVGEVDPPEDVLASEDDPIAVVAAWPIKTRRQWIIIIIVVVIISFVFIIVVIIKIAFVFDFKKQEQK